MDDKIIVTHRTALLGKYGTKGVFAIEGALKGLISADKKRNLKTRVVYLDDARSMKKLGAKPLDSVKDYKGAKAAIDGVFKAVKPDYLMILGAPDVVPHQDLTNPAFDAGDDDPKAWGDLPYACDAPYGRDTALFVGPTRVVGRLPDLTGAKEPTYLIGLLKIAADWSSRPPSDYAAYFGLSTFTWRGSTKMSLDNIFGNNTQILLAPTSGPRYSAAKLGARMHFINCHGAMSAPEFYGQKGNSYPVSLNTKNTKKMILEGTVAAVECCYGSELYDAQTLELDIPICQSYLSQGAYGYFGSTTIAYGPADDNGSADLICQYFLLNVQAGASVGRAALMARQQFVDHAKQMDPMDLKTLAQFCLLGDPSVTPVAAQSKNQTPKGMSFEDAERFRRRERRAQLKQKGDFLKQTKPTASKRVKGGRISTHAKTALANLVKKTDLPLSQAFTPFEVKGGRQPKGQAAKLASAPSRYLLTVGKPKNGKGRALDYRVAIIAKEVNGRIVDYCIYHQR
jgi:hypothetical protein